MSVLFEVTYLIKLTSVILWIYFLIISLGHIYQSIDLINIKIYKTFYSIKIKGNKIHYPCCGSDLWQIFSIQCLWRFVINRISNKENEFYFFLFGLIQIFSIQGLASVTWLKYCWYSFRLSPINQSFNQYINQSCKCLSLRHQNWGQSFVDWMIDLIEFYSVSAIFQPCNGGYRPLDKLNKLRPRVTEGMER